MPNWFSLGQARPGQGCGCRVVPRIINDIIIIIVIGRRFSLGPVYFFCCRFYLLALRPLAARQERNERTLNVVAAVLLATCCCNMLTGEFNSLKMHFHCINSHAVTHRNKCTHTHLYTLTHTLTHTHTLAACGIW